MSYSPKDQFKKLHEQNFMDFRPVSESSYFKNAITHAIALMVEDGSTTEEFKGANRFIACLYGLVEDAPVIRKLPVKSLKVLDKDESPIKA